MQEQRSKEMAANMTGMQVEGTTVIGTADGGSRRLRGSGAYSVAAAGLVVIALAGLLLWVVNGTGTSHVTTAPAPAGVVGTSIGQGESDAIRFVEQNTITLPSAGGADAIPYMESFTPFYGQDR
jgi:hypothetical protein